MTRVELRVSRLFDKNPARSQSLWLNIPLTEHGDKFSSCNNEEYKPSPCSPETHRRKQSQENKETQVSAQMEKLRIHGREDVEEATLDGARPR